MGSKEGSIKKLMKSKITSDNISYNVDNLSSEELHESVHRIKKNPIEPFKFLSHVLDDVDDEDRSSLSRTKSTDIDFQLFSLIKRVDMNRTVLERTNQHVKDINFILEKNKILDSRELNYDKKTLAKVDKCRFKSEPSIEHPEIDKVQRTMRDTLQMLECMKKVTFCDLDSEKLASEFSNKVKLGSSSSQSESAKLKSNSHRKDRMG